MILDVRGKNIDVTSALRQHVERKLSRLKRFFSGIDTAHVRLSVAHGIHTVEVTIPVAGMVLRGEERTSDMYTSIDHVVEKLERQLKRYQRRLVPALQRVGVVSGASVTETDTDTYEEGRLMRTKQFAAKPMTVDEAIMQMNLIGHDFYAFRNAENELINVVYRRRDGNYGLLEPDL